jgi:SAM-dependent methyltransferase
MIERFDGIASRVPPRLRAFGKRLLRMPVSAPPGAVHFGDFRRTTPIATDFGYGRGGPVDRYYIESFLERHRLDVRGRVMEIGDSAYSRRFGDDRLIQADVLHVDPDSGATFVGDLADGSFLPDAAFDCIVLTQTLHLVYDFGAALRTIARVLAPGGVLLMTVPGISNADPAEWGPTWHYSFTHHSVERMCNDAFAGFEIDLESFGNVLAAVAFLHGLGKGELTQAELDEHHVEYSLIHSARIKKPSLVGG